MGSDNRFLFIGNEISMEWARSCCLPKQRPLLRLILLSFIGLWVKIWHRKKNACSKSDPVQSSRSESTNCPRKGSLLRFEQNSTATSDACAQKLWNDVWRDSESITTKVCSKNRSQMKCDAWKPCSDQRWQACFYACQCTDVLFLYCCALYIFFFLDFVCGDLALTGFLLIAWTSDWSTWSPARGPDSATCVGLAHGRDCSDCRASELKLQSAWPLFFLELSKILLNNGLLWGFSNPHPSDC